MKTDWKLTKNSKDWIRYDNDTRKETVQIITYGKKYKWDLNIMQYNSRPIIHKKNISKTEARQIANNYMKK
jgi:hypothetical protein